MILEIEPRAWKAEYYILSNLKMAVSIFVNFLPCILIKITPTPNSSQFFPPPCLPPFKFIHFVWTSQIQFVLSKFSWMRNLTLIMFTYHRSSVPLFQQLPKTAPPQLPTMGTRPQLNSRFSDRTLSDLSCAGPVPALTVALSSYEQLPCVSRTHYFSILPLASTSASHSSVPSFMKIPKPLEEWSEQMSNSGRSKSWSLFSMCQALVGL